MDGVAAPWFAFMAIGTYQHYKSNGATLPPPALYGASSIVFALLALVDQAPAARTAVSLAAWALVIAQVLKANPLPGSNVDTFGTAAATGAKTPAGGSANYSNQGVPTKGQTS